MLVEELIQMLQTYDPKQQVVFGCNIESGRSISSCSTGTVSIGIEHFDNITDLREQLISEMGYYYEEELSPEEVIKLENLVENYKPRVTVTVSGEETFYQ